MYLRLELLLSLLVLPWLKEYNY